MKYLHWVVMGVVATSAGMAATGEETTDKRSAAWVAEFQRYASQDRLETDSGYSGQPGNGAQFLLIDLLRQLPEPAAWPALRQAMSAAMTQVPAKDPLQKQRLQAGSWLLAYLAGDRTAIEAEVKAAETAAGSEDSSQTGYALRNLRERLSGRDDETEMPPEKQLEALERQMVMLEPVDEAAVIRALGGEENFAHLKRLLEVARTMQGRMEKIYEEYEKTKDKAAARAQMEAWEKEYQEKTAAEQQALASFQNDPLVQRYVLSVQQKESGGEPDRYTPALYVPDLVKIAGPERAEILLRRALRLRAKIEIGSTQGEATRQLAAKLVLAEIATVQVPSWGLVRDENAMALFEALRQKFPTIDPQDSDFRQACGYYLAGLIQQGRTAEAVKFVSERRKGGDEDEQISLPYAMASKLEETHARELWEFLQAWLSVNPAADEWDRFTRLSVVLERRTELKALLMTLADNGSFQGMDRLQVQQLQAGTELATGEFAPALTRLRSLVQTPAETEKERAVQMRIIERLLKLADLQDDATGFASTLATAEVLLEKGKNDKPDQKIQASGGLASELNALGHFSDSARIGRMALAQIAEYEKKNVTKKDDEAASFYVSEYVIKDILAVQLCAEVELGHMPEAAALLQENAWWGAKDAAALLNRHLSYRGRPVGYYVARVTQAQGDLALTLRILEAQLVATPAVDAVYEFYLKLAGQEALPLMEKLAASDRYEERPLIWKARLQLEAKQWDAAVVTLQQAITIDPSDGEQGRGDRMRVYAFMSEVMAAKGDAEKATFFANVVKAIRLSETADRWFEVGAYARAIELYRTSLGFFQDAYCIQSRLAVRLADEGKMDEAAEHYRRAFELMPDSFGRVESHCFGCEHVFAGKKSQGVAEEVFTRMLKARPEKPQLHYLNGYLREEQERLPEAAEYYRAAVKLDPLYLNAWNRLAGLEDKLKFTPAQRDDLLLRLVELDPAHRHVSPSLEKVADLPRLWRVMQETGHVLEQLPKTGALWELKASAARLAQKKDGETPLWPDEANERKDFAAVLRTHSFVQALQSYLAALKPMAPNESGQPAVVTAQ